MDGTTEPIIAVIGHPIAGNPTQFAIERALHSLGMDWRVLSFDVDPIDIAAALNGFTVTGIAGVIIDPSVCREASVWYRDTVDEQTTATDEASEQPETRDEDVPLDADNNDPPGEPDPTSVLETKPAELIDCLFRDDRKRFVGSYEQRSWIEDTIAQHAGTNRIWLGESLDNMPLRSESLPELASASPPDPDVVATANLIVLTEQSDGVLEVDEWPTDDGSTLVIDLTGGHADQPALQRLGYRVVTEMERRIGTLHRCLERWTGEQVSTDVLHDAIEEYLGV